jgi:Zn-dependent peptidase ImmA (M78 family)
MSVAHELGHLVLHRRVSSGTQELETHAYRFAAELLMPMDLVSDQLAVDRLNLFRLAELKGTWGVSMQALARRARELNIINGRQYLYLMKQLSMKGWRTVEPNLSPLQVERPRAIRKLAEVVLGPSLNLKQVALNFALTEAFLKSLLGACAPPPKRNEPRPSRRGGDILAFTRNA